MENKRLGGPWRDKDGNYHPTTQFVPKHNIFENAYFGKPYKTRDGRKAIFIQPYGYWVAIQDEINTHSYFEDGHILLDGKEHPLDIISEWEEEISEEELNKLAERDVSKRLKNAKLMVYITPRGVFTCPDLTDIYKAGYREALNNK